MRKRIALLVGTLAVVAMASVAQAATMFAVGSAEQFQVSDTGVVSNGLKVSGYSGFGTTTPGSALHVTGAVARDAQLFMQQNSPTALAVGATGAGVLLYYNQNNALPPASTRLGYVYFGGLDGTAQKSAAGIVGYAEGTWTAAPVPQTSPPTPTASGAGFYFATTDTTLGAARTERLRITGKGYVGIGTSTPSSILTVANLPVCTDNSNATAVAPTGCGLSAGGFYRTATGQLMVAY